MQSNNSAFTVIYLLLIVVLFPLHFHEVSAAGCGTGKRPLFFAVDPRLERFIPREFSTELLTELNQPLQEIGYCITRYNSSIINDSTLQNELIMMLSLNVDVTEKSAPRSADEPVDDETYAFLYHSIDTVLQVIVSTISVGNWGALERRKALSNPLLSLAYRPDEVSTFKSVLIKKIVENLRIQYICHLRIESIPNGVTIQSTNGLEGTTPLEWITPVGSLPIIAELDGYEPVSRKINLFSPGNHTYVLQMRRRQFYHSKLFNPTVVCAGSSAASFLAMYYFYDRYEHLDDNTKYNHSGQFRRTYTTAVAFEAAGYTLLAAAAGLFTFSFYY